MLNVKLLVHHLTSRLERVKHGNFQFFFPLFVCLFISFLLSSFLPLLLCFSLVPSWFLFIPCVFFHFRSHSLPSTFLFFYPSFIFISLQLFCTRFVEDIGSLLAQCDRNVPFERCFRYSKKKNYKSKTKIIRAKQKL